MIFILYKYRRGETQYPNLKRNLLHLHTVQVHIIQCIMPYNAVAIAVMQHAIY